MTEIYLIYAVDSNFFKIGIAKDIKKRIAGLQTACPFDLKLLSTRPGDVGVEQAIQNHLKSFHVRGEWFRFASPPQAMFYFAEWSPRFSRKHISYLAERRSLNIESALDNVRA